MDAWTETGDTLQTRAALGRLVGAEMRDNLTILCAVRGGTWARQSGRPAAGRTIGAAGLGIVAGDLWVVRHEEGFGMGPDEIHPIRRANPADIKWAWQPDPTCLAVAGERRMVRALTPEWERWKGMVNLSPLNPGEDHPGNARYAAALAAAEAQKAAEARQEAEWRAACELALAGPIMPTAEWLTAHGADRYAIAAIVGCDVAVRDLSADEKEVWSLILAGQLPHGEVAEYLPAPTCHRQEAVHALMIRVARDRALGLWINAQILDLATQKDGWDRDAAVNLCKRLTQDIKSMVREAEFWRTAEAKAVAKQGDVCVPYGTGNTRDEWGDWEVQTPGGFTYEYRHWYVYEFRTLSREETISGPLSERSHDPQDPEAVRARYLEAASGDSRRRQIADDWAKTIPESPYFSLGERAELQSVYENAVARLLGVE